MEEDQRELQLLPTPQYTRGPYARAGPSWPLDTIRYRSSDTNIQYPNLETTTTTTTTTTNNGPSLDLQLSISLRPIQPAAPVQDHHYMMLSHNSKNNENNNNKGRGVEALKWQAADQIRIATMEKAYAERVREMTKREMELAQSEFSRARHMWERAREEVERVEKMKERATRRIDSTCMEITCQACRQKFRH